MAYKYSELADQLRQRLTAGEWERGAAFLSISEIMAKYESSQAVTRDALAALQDEGWISMRPGAVSIVRGRIEGTGWVAGELRELAGVIEGGSLGARWVLHLVNEAEAVGVFYDRADALFAAEQLEGQGRSTELLRLSGFTSHHRAADTQTGQ